MSKKNDVFLEMGTYSLKPRRISVSGILNGGNIAEWMRVIGYSSRNSFPLLQNMQGSSDGNYRNRTGKWMRWSNVSKLITPLPFTFSRGQISDRRNTRPTLNPEKSRVAGLACVNRGRGENIKQIMDERNIRCRGLQRAGRISIRTMRKFLVRCRTGPYGPQTEKAGGGGNNAKPEKSLQHPRRGSFQGRRKKIFHEYDDCRHRVDKLHRPPTRNGGVLN